MCETMDVKPEDNKIIEILKKAGFSVEFLENGQVKVFCDITGETIENDLKSVVDIAGAEVVKAYNKCIDKIEALDDAEHILRKQGRW